MRLEEEDRGAHAVLTLAGSITTSDGAARLSDALARAESDRTGTIVLDVTELRHLDSTALGSVVGTMRRLHATGREVRLVGVGPRLQLLLQLTHLDAMFPKHATVADALAAERNRRPSADGDASGGEALGDRNRHDV